VFPLEWKDPSTGEISSGYRERGYEPEAFVNMLALLGWNPGTEQEIMNMSELIEKFSFEHVHKAGAKFNPEKTLWFNTQYVHHMANEILAAKLKIQVVAALILNEKDVRLEDNYLSAAASLIKPRVHFTHELYQTASYLFEAPTQYDTQVIEKRWKPELQPFFEQLILDLNVINEFNAAHADAQFKQSAANAGLKPGDVLQLFRVMLSGQGSGVDLFGMIALLGKEEVSARINKALAHFKK
jgi:glutamyl-tRNA synthetase